jgi:hypothetical protein
MRAVRKAIRMSGAGWSRSHRSLLSRALQEKEMLASIITHLRKPGTPTRYAPSSTILEELNEDTKRDHLGVRRASSPVACGPQLPNLHRYVFRLVVASRSGRLGLERALALPTLDGTAALSGEKTTTVLTGHDIS